jgi:hypothetical protein
LSFNGPDDYLAITTDEAMAKVLDGARTVTWRKQPNLQQGSATETSSETVRRPVDRAAVSRITGELIEKCRPEGLHPVRKTEARYDHNGTHQPSRQVEPTADAERCFLYATANLLLETLVRMP